jgi:hypothetical protein
VPIDTVDFTFSCMPKGFETSTSDGDGAYVSGMFIDGARWDWQAGELAEPLPKVGMALAACLLALLPAACLPASLLAFLPVLPSCLLHHLWQPILAVAPCTLKLTVLTQDPLLQVLRTPAPVMLFKPAVGATCDTPHYECPLYRTTERRGVLATTGHSTNFVMELQVPSSKPQDHWVRAGVAFVLSLPE